MNKIFRRTRDTPESVATDAGLVSHRELGQTKVQNFGAATLGHKNICRLDITMNNAVSVGGVQSVGDLDPER